MDPTDLQPRRANVALRSELELVPLGRRDGIGLFLICASLCVVSCGGVLFFGSADLHVRGRTGFTGLALILGGCVVYGLTAWLLEPHESAKHASHRIRHHARRLRGADRGEVQSMTDDEFNELEDRVQRSSRTRLD
jgi:hypothetical protein